VSPASQMDRIRKATYPGRGIVIGQSPDGNRIFQVYWIMGRSEGSRNRIFIHEGDTVRTWAFDESKVADLSLVVYHPIRTHGASHIVTNGDQTDTIVEHLAQGGTFESALDTRAFEPDPPILTPRISGIVDLDDEAAAYRLAILKTVGKSADHPTRHYFTYERFLPGYGHCITTYDDDGDPVPSFSGEPYLVDLLDDIEETADSFWNTLNEDNRVSLLVKSIGPDGASQIHIINKHNVRT
jgi:IMP cyclohydrolase